MVGLLGCGCCASQQGYCEDGVSSTGTFLDEFKPPFLNDFLPPGQQWATPKQAFGSSFTTWEGWFKWRQYRTSNVPWVYALADGKFNGFILRKDSLSTGSAISKYWTPLLNQSSSSDSCVYSANYRIAKYLTEVDISLPVSGAPTVQEVNYASVEPSRKGPSFSLSGAWTGEKEIASIGGRAFGPTLVVGMHRLTPASPYSHYWCVVDKYTAANDSIYGSYTAGPVNYLISKYTYKLGIEIECINLQDYGKTPGPIFQGKAFIDGAEVYRNIYGPFIDNGATQIGGVNNWRPSGFCRCMFCGLVGGASQSHPSPTFDPISKTHGWTFDATKAFWADNFKFTEIPL